MSFLTHPHYLKCAQCSGNRGVETLKIPCHGNRGQDVTPLPRQFRQVTTLGAQYQARAYSAYMPAPAVRPVWGLEEKDVGEGATGSAYVEWLYTDLPDEPLSTLPPGSEDVLEGTEWEGGNTDPHECQRREPAAQEQLWLFLTTGEVVQTCGEEGCKSVKGEVCGSIF